MEKIKIITVSTADLPKDIIDKYDIEVLPLLVNIGDKSYLDGIDITTSKLLEIMDTDGVFPTTMQVNPQRHYECFKKYLEEGYKIIMISMSSKMSGTYQSACIAKDMLETDDIAVIDSLNVTSGLGVLVLKACRLRDAGYDFDKIAEEIINTIPHVKSAIAFNRLDNLIKGGRLSKAAGTIGNILGIKLILTIKDGEMIVVDKVRGTKKAAKSILNYASEVGISKNETSILLYIGENEVRELLEDTYKDKEGFIECEAGCVVGTHSGSGACGIFFIEE
ncbi:EDD domain protein, DegV family [Clostridium acidisoli DSM 12555]|uniref:EDD domain protein, DegV family n=1 Tax=Clostridium acidisoli DSM 12555 TaxID=1121291 RepID=A0A1W1XJC7_9CLOT|nr:DegV family protein [Clostridium acidisoli]SMC23917.1 EDD domain protein, DegV family [Clostridium acidisoli DSM 12555]